MIVSCSNDPYANLSLAESCIMMESSVKDLYNELMMNILLKEHSYFIENSHEMTYVNEDGSDTEEGKKTKSSFSDFFKKVWSNIKAAWNKCISWVTSFIYKTKNALIKFGLNKKEVKDAFDYIDRTETFHRFKIKGSALNRATDEFYSDIESGAYFKLAYTDKIIDSNEIFSKYTTGHNTGFTGWDEGYSMLFDSPSYIKKIENMKRKSLDELNATKATVSNDIDQVKYLNINISNISKLSSVAIKCVYTSTKYSAAIARQAIQIYHERDKK